MFRAAVFGLALGLAGVGADAVRASADITGLSDPTRIGEARLSFLGFVIYEGQLFTERGRPFSPGEPVALEILYRRSFSAQQMLQATYDELGRVEGRAPDQQQLVTRLSSCFRDVGDGDRFLAISRGPDDLELKLNGTRTCAVNAPRLGERFLSIWLSDNSRFPRLSRRLRGM
jgi:hypothetical protein